MNIHFVVVLSGYIIDVQNIINTFDSYEKKEKIQLDTDKLKEW